MKIKILCCIAVAFSTISLHPQISYIFPITTSVARTSVSDFNQPAAFVNPAIYSTVSKATFSVSFDNRFFLPELSTRSVSAAYNAGIVQTGISFSYYGFSLYNEWMTGLAFARDFGGKFNLGFQLNYYAAYFYASNRYAGSLFPQLGFRIRLTPEFSLAGNFFNPFQSDIHTDYNTKRLPSVFSLATALQISPCFEWRVQADKEVSSSYRFATGCDYRFLNRFVLNAGIYYSDFPVSCLGFGWQTGKFSVHIHAELHPVLGLNTSATIGYTLK